MHKELKVVLLVLCVLLLPRAYVSLPLCTDLRSPFSLNTSKLSFCPYPGPNCCTLSQDLILRKQYEAMSVSDSNCASLVKSILCAKCDPYSAELFSASGSPRTIPVLCNSTVSGTSSQSSQSQVDFCSRLWDTCQNATMSNLPFVAPGSPVISTKQKLADVWKSKIDFCDSYGGPSAESVCFAGSPVELNASGSVYPPPSGLCLEKLGNGSYLNMAPHPDGSNRAFFANQAGKIWLATIPKIGSGGTLAIDESSPFIDLTDEVFVSDKFGMMGVAFHPSFTENGRFFASFNCDKAKWPRCTGKCSCNSDVGCDPSKLPADNGAQPCQYNSVIAEYTINGSSADTAKPVEVRRIITMGLPFTSHHAGQILFGPNDGYLYFMMGDGGSTGTGGDPYNFAQNKKSLLGKIMRFDIDSIPTAEEIIKQNLWGNYSIPKDNPYKEDNELLPEIWALGLRNPWRCSFDSVNPSYFICADVGQDKFEEVNLITKGGNYGWRVYEATELFTPLSAPGGSTSPKAIDPIFPVMGYNHSEVNKNEGSASITGGYFYRSQTDPCIYGSYLYADLYSVAMWAGRETPVNSGNFTRSGLSFRCDANSPIACTFLENGTTPVLGFIFSFGEDNNKDVYVLSSSGVYRVVQPSRCGYACSKQPVAPALAPPKGSSAGALLEGWSCGFRVLVLVIFAFWFEFAL